MTTISGQRAVIDTGIGKIQFAQVFQVLQVFETRSLHQCSRQAKRAKATQRRESRQAGIGNGRVAEVEFLQAGEFLNGSETKISHLCNLQFQCFQCPQCGQICQLLIANRRWKTD